MPRHLTTQKKDKHINLLIVENYYYIDETEELSQNENADVLPHQEKENFVYKWHYAYIKDLSRLCRQQFSSYEGKAFICNRCLHYFWSNEKLSARVIDC